MASQNVRPSSVLGCRGKGIIGPLGPSVCLNFFGSCRPKVLFSCRILVRFCLSDGLNASGERGIRRYIRKRGMVWACL